jgi:predicted RNA binding protein YcfA (HicA-like mRNA interferase family)
LPKLSPLKSRDLINKLRTLGFEGPFAGGRHSRMVHFETGQVIPIPIHNKEVSVGLIREIIRQVDITPEQWLEL